MANITKIYDIKLQGEKELVDQMQKVNKQFDDAKKQFKDLKAIVSAGGLSSADMEKYKLELQQANIELVKAKKANQDATLEAKAYSLAKRQQTDAEKQNRAESKLTLDMYQTMSKNLNDLRKNAKAVGAEFGIFSPEFKQASTEANKLDKELKAIDASLGQFQRNVGNYPKEINVGGLSSGVINQLKNSGLGNVLGNQVDQTKSKVIQLNSEFVQMKQKLDQAKASGVTDLNDLEKGIINNRIEADKLGTEIQQSQTHINGLGSVGSNIFGKMNIDLKTLVLGYVGLQAAMSAVTDVAHKNYEMSDSLADLQIRLKGSKEDTDYLVAALKKIPTRTSLAELIDTGSIVAKKGVAKEEIAGITEALDKYFIVAGKGAGNREEGTASIVKLISIFNDDKHITKERVEELSSGLVGLQNSGVATGEKMINLAERIGAVRGITGVSLPSVLGMGAALEQLGQKSEVAGTAGIQIITKMFANVPKYASMAGMSVKDFQKLLDSNPLEALVKLAEKLKAGKSFEEIASDMEEVGVKGARVKAVLGDIAGNADFMRKRMKDANEMMKNTGALSDANAIKQKNYAATIDGMKKSFELLATDPRVLNFLSSISNAALATIKFITAIPFGVFITGVSLMGAAWLYYKGEAISAGLATQWNNEQTLLGTIRNYAYRLGIIETGTAQYMLAEATKAEMLATEGATVAQEGLNVAMEMNPLGIILALIGLAIPLFSSFTSVTNLNTKSINDNSKALSSAKEVQNEFNASFAKSQADLRSKIEPLLAIFKSEQSSLDVRKKAYQDLIKISPDFVGTLDDEFRATDKLTGVYDKLIAKLKEVEIARAQEKVRQRRADNLAKAQEQEYINAQKAQEEINQNRINKEQNKGIQADADRGSAASGGYASSALIYHANKLEISTKAQDEYSKSILRTKQAQKEFDDYVAYQVKNGLTGKPTASDSTTGGVAPPNPDDKASKLTGQQKDYLRDINALREAELSELKKSKLEGSITEEQFLRKSLAVNIKYNDKILEHFKGTDAITRKLRADTASDSIDKKIETNAKLFKLQEDELNQTLSNEKAIAQAKLEDVNSDPYSSSLDKAQAEEQYYETLLNLQVDFNTKMDALENALKQESKKNAEDRKNLILKEQSDLNKKQYQLSKAQFDSLITGVEDFKTYRKNNAEIEASKQRMLILNDKSLNQKEKEHEIDKINAALSLANTNIELGAVNAEIKFYEDRIAKQRLTNEEQKTYNDLLKQKQLLEEGKAIGEDNVKKKGAAQLSVPSDANTQSIITSNLTQSLGLSEGEGALLGNAIAQSFDLAKQAMSSYFEGERQAVEQSKQLAYQRIDLEKRQLLAKAQSQAERDSIERQSATKKALADKEAHEKLKKIKKQELTIAFALQLANIAVAAASNPTNGVTFGASGLIMYGILAAIAAAGYAINMANVDKQTFKRGGKLPTKGGPFVGNSHDDGGIPVGMNEFEGDELAIINKKSAKTNEVFTVTGTPNQIASKINAIGGGVDWAGGASLTKYMNGGAFLGSKVQPPVFRSYYENRGQSNNIDAEFTDVAGLHDSILELRNIVLSESRKKIVLNPNDVEDYQREKNKQSEIATL